MTTRLLEIENAAFGYADTPILEGLDLSLCAGELVGVIGPNGSGKTTLVRGATRILEPLNGRVLLRGECLTRCTRQEIARAVAVVPQESAPLFSYTALETVLMGRAPWLRPLEFESDDDVAIAERALDAMGARDLASRSVQELSGGERQRVVLARALAQETPVLLADEPTAHLDMRHAVELFALLRGIADERGLAVMIVTHDLNLAAAHCDRLALLAKGRIQAQGAVADVLSAEILSEAFETRVDVGRGPDGSPWIQPRPR